MPGDVVDVLDRSRIEEETLVKHTVDAGMCSDAIAVGKLHSRLLMCPCQPAVIPFSEGNMK